MPDDPESLHEPEPEPLHELTFGRRPGSPPPITKATSSSSQPDDSLRSLYESCLQKSQALRARVEQERRARDRWISSTPVQAELTPELSAWSQSTLESYQWATLNDPLLTGDMSTLDTLAGCYETTAGAALLLHSSSGRPGSLAQMITLLAEAQSALRAALKAIRGPDDPDQLELFEIVRLTAAREQVYLPRFMRADDLADPEDWAELLGRVEGAAGNHPRSRRLRVLLDQLRTQVAASAEAAEMRWLPIFETVNALLSEGLPPSSVELRNLLLPHLNDLPEDESFAPAFNLVLREIDQYLATRAEPAPGPSSALSTSTEEVQRVRRLIDGRSLVLIGGIRRPQAQLQLEAEFGLESLIWVATREHQSIEGFETVIARTEVAAVLLAIRWASHSFGEIKQFCDKHGKPLVRLPAGYGPNQVAVQIISQCSSQLEQR